MDRLKKNKNKLTLDDLNILPKEVIISKVLKMQDQIIQLTNILGKHKEMTSSKNKIGRPFDFSRFPKIHLLMKCLYLGWDYNGYSISDGTNQTIEHFILEALTKSRLIESRETANYEKCGRTDKGVSSFEQVVSVTVRASSGPKPLDYCGIMNRLLPDNIRVTGWSQVNPGFSARFDCSSRMYRYYFPKADLNIEAMMEASQLLVGVHDFRNFCKMDVNNGVTNFVREMLSVSIIPVEQFTDLKEGYCMFELRVVGKAFLWHQIRYMMAVLLMVGEGLESPSIVQSLLDIGKQPRRPQYKMAHHLGLCLFSTNFLCEGKEIEWNFSQEELKSVINNLQSQWTEHHSKCTQIREMLRSLESNLAEPEKNQAKILLTKDSKIHKPLLKRNTCNSLEERVERYKKRIKADDQEMDTALSLDLTSVNQI